jgi:hypothetical protein
MPPGDGIRSLASRATRLTGASGLYAMSGASGSGPWSGSAAPILPAMTGQKRSPLPPPTTVRRGTSRRRPERGGVTRPRRPWLRRGAPAGRGASRSSTRSDGGPCTASRDPVMFMPRLVARRVPRSRRVRAGPVAGIDTDVRPASISHDRTKHDALSYRRHHDGLGPGYAIRHCRAPGLLVLWSGRP